MSYDFVNVFNNPKGTDQHQKNTWEVWLFGGSDTRVQTKNSHCKDNMKTQM